MPKGLPQASFTMGEISPALYGRIDFDGYYKGLKTCRNMIISKYGGADNRPGTEFIDYVHDSTVINRIIPFQYNNQQQYVLELGNKTLRIIANGVVLNTNQAYVVTAVTPAVGSVGLKLTITGHPFNTNDEVIVNGVGSGIDGTWTIKKTSSSIIELVGCSLLTYSWSGGGTVQALSGTSNVIVTPWASADIFALKYTQSADVVTVTHPNYPTYQIQRYSQTSWAVTLFVNTNGPFQDINIDETKTVYASAETGTITITSNADIFTAGMVGELFYIQHSPNDHTYSWEVGKGISVDAIVVYGSNYYIALSSGTTGTIPPTAIEGTQRDGDPGVLWQYINSGFGIVKITGYTSTKIVTASVIVRLPKSLTGLVTSVSLDHNFAITEGEPTWWIVTKTPHGLSNGDNVTLSGTGTGLDGTWIVQNVNSTQFRIDSYYGGETFSNRGSALVITATSYWAKSAWGVIPGYPGTTAYFQGRQLFGGTNGEPSRFDMSRTRGFFDFGQSNPILDDDAITYTLLSNKVNIIKHLLELQYLIIMTTGGIWMAQGGKSGGSGTLTPGSIDLQFQSSQPVGDIPPLKISNYALFVQEKGNQVRTLGYSFAENAFIGQDITTMSNHLLQFNTIVDWAYQEIPYSCAWAVRDDGVLLGLTFFPEQQVTAWHRHDTQGTFESVCCVTENNKDVVYFIVKRTLNGQVKRCIERMAQRSFVLPADAFLVDCGLTYNLSSPASIFTGLDHLDGETVSILGDGISFPQQIVSGGQVTLSKAVSKCQIGLPYTSDFGTLAISSQRSNIRDKQKSINAVSLIVDKSSGFQTGPDEDNLQPYKTTPETYDAADPLLSQLVDYNIPCAWDKNGLIFVRQEKPLPLSILAVIPQLEVSGF
jgi:hypothetical protein